MIKKHQSQGFAVVEMILILVVLGLVGFTGWFVLNSKKKSDAVLDAANKSTVTDKKATKTSQSSSEQKSFVLASDKVTFKTPLSWTKDGVGCVKDSNMFGAQEYLDSMALLPGEKLPTIYGGGTEYFHVNVCVFKNTKSISPKKWFNEDVGGSPSEKDIETSSVIGNSTVYYQKATFAEHSYDEVNYVIAAKDKFVFVSARTYETDTKQPGVGDFRKYEGAIRDLVNTIQIN